MAWNYDASLVRTSPLMYVRMKIGDTDSTDPLLQDEEIEATLVTESPPWAAATSCELIAAKYSRKIDKQVGRLRLSASGRAKSFHDLARSLRAEAGRINTGAYFGGDSVTEKQQSTEDPDVVQPSFTTETMEPTPVTPTRYPRY